MPEGQNSRSHSRVDIERGVRTTDYNGDIEQRKRITRSFVAVREVVSYLDRDRWMNLKEASEYLSVSNKTIRKHQDEIPHHDFFGITLFRKSELDQVVKRQVQEVDLDRLGKLAMEGVRELLK